MKKTAFLIIAALLSLAGCNVGESRYLVADRFVVTNPVDEAHKYFIVLELPPDEWKQQGDKTVKFRDEWLTRDIWMDCYLEDIYVVKLTGQGRCVRTEASQLDLPPTEPTPHRRSS